MCGSSMKKKKCKCDAITLFIIVYFGLNVGINIFNKWMFSVLNYRIPLTVTAIHQFIAFLVFLPVEIKRHYSGLAKRQEESEKKGLRADSSFFGSYIPRDVTCFRFTVTLFGLATFSALNYGLVAVALMRLSLADHQLIRSTGPLFVAITFLILERRQFTCIKVIVLLTTVGGVVLAVAAHTTTFKLDIPAVYMCIAANFASAMQLSLTGEAKRKLKLNAINTIVFTSAQICLLITPFIFVTGEHKIVARLVNEHALVLGGCIAVGSVIVLVYLAVSIHVIQETTSFFVSIAANFKMVPIIILSELLVQNTSLTGGVYVGMIIVTLAFCASLLNTRWLESPKKEDRTNSPCIKLPCLDRLSDPFCPPLDPKKDDRRPLCCTRELEAEERPILTRDRL